MTNERSHRSGFGGNSVWNRLGSVVVLFLFLVAPRLRIMPDFAGFCRVKFFICFVFRRIFGTLDQHIGVRIPGGQPIFMLVS